jgi:hypothetical protein
MAFSVKTSISACASLQDFFKQWDVKSGEVKLFPDLVPDNAIQALTIYKNAIIFNTVKKGNGLPSVNDAPNYVCKMTFDGKIIQKKEVNGANGSICLNGESGIIAIGQDLCLLNPETLDVKPIGLKLSGAHLRKYKDHIIAVAKDNCYVIDQYSGQILLKTGGVGVQPEDVCVNGNEIWASGNNGWIYRLIIN